MSTGQTNTWSSSITTTDLQVRDMQANVRTVQGAPACPFRVKIGSEWAVVAATIGGTTPRLVFSERGTEGSTVAKHVKGTLLYQVVTAADLTQLMLAARQIGPQARSVATRLYLAQNAT